MRTPALDISKRRCPPRAEILIRKASVVVATPLLAVLVLVEITDSVFAVDSIPAILSVTSEPFLVFTANAFAALGLRATRGHRRRRAARRDARGVT